MPSARPASVRRLLLPALALLGGCAAEGVYPSLEPRAVEKLGFGEPVRSTPVIPQDPALTDRIDGLLSEARAGQADYAARLDEAQLAVRNAGAAGGETWVQAQQAVSRLEAARHKTVSALAELDALAVSRAEVPTSEADLAALTAAIAAASDLARRQQDGIDGLRGRLRPA